MNTRTINCPGSICGSSPCPSRTACLTAPAAKCSATSRSMIRPICLRPASSTAPPRPSPLSTPAAAGRFRPGSTSPAGPAKVLRNVSGVCWNARVTTVRNSAAQTGTNRIGSAQIGPAQIGPVQLARLLRVPEPTPEQAAVIAAPLGPMAVIAGAGSGKSETMAARLVWLVANGMVRPERVLGLTFTRKAAAELGDRVRSRLEPLRRSGLGETTQTVRPEGEHPFDGDPVIGTYHAYAGRLVGDNALREGLEPSMRLITPALSWQLAAGIVAAYDGPMDEIIWTPQTVTAALLDLAGDLAEHLRDAGDVSAVGEWLATELEALPGRVPAAVRKILATQRAREQL